MVATLCYAIVLPARRSTFRAGIFPDYRESTEIGPAAGLQGRFRFFPGGSPANIRPERPIHGSEALLRNIEYNQCGCNLKYPTVFLGSFGVFRALCWAGLGPEGPQTVPKLSPQRPKRPPEDDRTTAWMTVATVDLQAPIFPLDLGAVNFTSVATRDQLRSRPGDAEMKD